jgi:hypothetical protein
MNNIDTAKLFQQTLDKVILQDLTSGWMESNSSNIIYNGGNEIKIADIVMTGMGDYDRNNGYVRGAVTSKFSTHILTQDRGMQFQIDPMDIDEGGFVTQAATIMAEFQRTQVVPEIDSYRYSKLANISISNGNSTDGYTATPSDILYKLNTDIYKILDATGLTEEDLVITMGIPARSILNNSSEISKKIDVGDFKRNEVTTKVHLLNGTPIIGVSSSRMKTKYIMNDGESAGQEQGGVTIDPTAKNINWIITTKTAPIGVVKTDVIRIFDPTQNQNANAYQIDFRKFHDLFVTKNKEVCVLVNTD